MTRVEVAAAVIEREDGRFLMASRPPGKVYEGWWEFPGGKVESGETAREALVRELREELGIEVETAYPWLNRDFVYPHAHVMLRFFRVTAWHGEPHPHEGQQLAWTQAHAPTVTPILPANGPILKGLQLPLEYAISDAAKLGEADFLQRLEQRLAGGLRLVQLREKPLTGVFAREVAARCQEHDAQLVINGDLTLAQTLGCGLHLSAAQLAGLESRPDVAWLGASCHDAGELARAAEVGADFVVLSPVLPTPSHPGEPCLGWPQFKALVRDYPLPVFALGGLARGDIALARAAGAHGVALKSDAWRLA